MSVNCINDSEFLWQKKVCEEFSTSVTPDGAEKWKSLYNRLHSEIFANDASSLHEASYLGCEIVVKNIIRAGVDVNESENTRTQYTPLHLAAEQGHRIVVELLLGAGADVQARTSFDYTPGDLAVARKHYDLFSYLNIKKTVGPCGRAIPMLYGKLTK